MIIHVRRSVVNLYFLKEREVTLLCSAILSEFGALIIFLNTGQYLAFFGFCKLSKLKKMLKS